MHGDEKGVIEWCPRQSGRREKDKAHCHRDSCAKGIDGGDIGGGNEHGPQAKEWSGGNEGQCPRLEFKRDFELALDH